MNNTELLLQYFPELTAQQLTQFQEAAQQYAEWNARINVISRKDMEHFMERHILHSLSIAKVRTFQPGETVIDLGTGGGFPALPLAILFPQTQFIAVDSIGKKVKVADTIAQHIGLQNLEAVWDRIENIKAKPNAIVTRAVAPMQQLLDWTHALRNHKKFDALYALKGGNLQEELSGIDKKISSTPISTLIPLPFFEEKYIIKAE